MKLHEAVRIDLGGDDSSEERWRPGVVLRVGKTYAQVAYGSRVQPPPDVPTVVILPGSTAGTRMDVPDPTWFQGRNYAYARKSDLKRLGCVCPMLVALEIAALVDDVGATPPVPF